jgi:hypothetical protein
MTNEAKLPSADDVLRRMLNTPPDPRIAKKPAKRKKAKKPAKK